MATGPSVQQNIQNKVGTQTRAQTSNPFLSNNGNPNTVYNTAQFTGYNPTPPQGGYIPPTYNGYNQWQVNPAPTTPAFPTFTMPGMPYSPFPQQPTPFLPPPISPFGGFGGGFGTPSSGGGWNGNTAPPTMGTGGPLPPEVAPTVIGGGGGGGGGIPAERRDDPWPQYNPIFGPNSTTTTAYRAGPPANGYGSNPFGNMSSPFGGNMGGLMGENGFDWRQAFDMASEPWLPGNLWLSGSNQWAPSNGILGMLGSLTGLPLNQWANNLGHQQAGQSDPQNFLERWLVNHWAMNANNDTYNNMAQSSNWGLNPNNGFNTGSIGWGQDGNAFGYSPTPFGGSSGMFGNQGWTPFSAGSYGNPTYNPSNPNPWAGATQSMFGPSATYAPAGQAGGGGGGGSGSTNEGGGTDACVTVDTIVPDYPSAGVIEVGDMMDVVDPKTFERSWGKVSYAETKTVPCVRITTESGIQLECSTTAPIADKDGNQVLAPELLGVTVAVMDNGMNGYDKVVDVLDIGNKAVRHITVEDNFFPAGKEEGRYLLHHNVKAAGGSGTGHYFSGWNDWGGMGSMFGAPRR